MKFRDKIRFLFGIYHSSDYIKIGRHLCKIHNAFMRKYYLAKYLKIGRIYHLDIPYSTFLNIGSNFCLAHPNGITINPGASIGNNVTVFKGCTIGSVRSGKREGVPTIGDNCVLGVNSFVAGGIVIGNNVLICANSFVDFDVPDDSMVLGNPGKIIHKENATKDYLYNFGD